MGRSRGGNEPIPRPGAPNLGPCSRISASRFSGHAARYDAHVTPARVTLICLALAWAVGVACSAQFPLWAAVMGVGLLCVAAVTKWPGRPWVGLLINIGMGVNVWRNVGLKFFGLPIAALFVLAILLSRAKSARRGAPPPAP
jgi:hypothetical protein